MKSPGRGIALLVVVGVLGVLAALAAVLVTVARLERKASQQRLEATRAFLLARSGIEDAVARVALGQDPDAAANAYLGEDWDGDLQLSGYEAAQEVYHRTGPGSPADTDACPLRNALRPSFCVRSSAGGPAELRMDGRDRGYSGALASDTAKGTYALKVHSGGIFVNGGDPAQPATAGYNAVLRRILGTLAEALDREDGADDGLPVDRTDGENLVTRRPASGWQGWEQVGAAGFSPSKLEAFRPYLTFSAWVDKRVIKPNNPPEGESMPYRGASEIKAIRRVDVPGSYAPGFERIGAGRILGRAPVSFAWARRRRPVLIALLDGLKGAYRDESNTTAWRDGNRAGFMRLTQLTNAWSPTDDCHKMADGILRSVAEVKTWSQFNALCDSLLRITTDEAQAALDAAQADYDDAWAAYEADPTASNEAAWAAAETRLADAQAAYDESGGVFSAPKRDLLKANFNPNTDLNKLNPNLSLWKTVDKSDLSAYSTEFSLDGAFQPLELESLGRVLDGAGRLLAARTLKSTLAGPSVLRLSTQRDFVSDSLGAAEVFGDETGVRLPGQASFLSLSRGPGRERTWGHALAGMGQGVALQSYPEPCTRPSGALVMTPADYDGNLQLATVETEAGDFYAVTAASQDLTLLARFDDRFDLDVAKGNSQCQAFASQLATNELGNSVFQVPKLNTLYPDGVYAESLHVPAYLGRGNMNGFHGVMSFWVKPDYLQRNFGRSHPYVMAPNVVQSSNPANMQFFFVGDALWNNFTGLCAQFEVGQAAGDTNAEHRFTCVWPQPHRWSLVTMAWDFLANTNHACGEIVLNDGSAGGQGSNDTYRYSSNAPLLATDLTLDADGGALAHLIALGPLAQRDARTDFLSANFPTYDAGGADATLDEFGIWDFGGAPDGGGAVPADTLLSPGILASGRYKSGRYYKGAAYKAPGDPAPTDDEAASWLSAPVFLPAGSLIRTIHWTWYRPVDLPDEYAELELVDPAGGQYLFGGDPVRSRSTQGRGWTPERQEWDVRGTSPAGGLRLRVVFRRVTPLDSNTPILDSPVLDDLTLLYDPPGGLRLSSWAEARE